MSIDHPLQENGSTADSDAESDAAGHDAYYHPISAYNDSDDGDDEELPSLQSPPSVRCNDAVSDLFHHHAAENGISALHLNGLGVGGGGGSDEDEDDHGEEEEEREREREASISRAFREDESRRSAPLAPEAAARVMDAMRGVSFQGIRPAWADQVPEARWADQLRGMRG